MPPPAMITCFGRFVWARKGGMRTPRASVEAASFNASRRLMPSIWPPSTRAQRRLGETPLRNLPQKRIALALRADRCRRTVSGENRRFVSKLEQCLVNGAHNFFERAAPKVRSSDARLKQRVAAENPGVLAPQVK